MATEARDVAPLALILDVPDEGSSTTPQPEDARETSDKSEKGKKRKTSEKSYNSTTLLTSQVLETDFQFRPYPHHDPPTRDASQDLLPPQPPLDLPRSHLPSIPRHKLQYP